MKKVTKYFIRFFYGIMFLRHNGFVTIARATGTLGMIID